MATISVRRLDLNGDVVRGTGQSAFLTDIDAVAQIIGTRLKLLQGEWWESLADGTPVFQQMLGRSASTRAQQGVAYILQQRILGTPYVTSISNVGYAFDRPSRAFGYACNVQTAFGTLSVSLTPGSNATLT